MLYREERAQECARGQGRGRGRAAVFAETENPFRWMSEAMDLEKEKNFLETRVIEYQNGSALSWE